MIVIFPRLIAKSFCALTIYPFIFLRDPASKHDFILINHEQIHINQQKELLWILFFAWYLTEFVLKLFYYRSAYQAYKNISFEREAYAHESDLFYLENRKRFSFIHYL